MVKYTSYGAAEMVTGSRHVIETEAGTKILLDCGLVQGKVEGREQLNHELGFHPGELDAMILSHAHIDHSGLIPRLVKLGFNKPIYATPATIDLCKVMLMDSAHIQNDDLVFVNKRRARKKLDPIEPLYDVEDVEKACLLFHPIAYHHHKKISSDISVYLTDAGHLLGSAMVHLDIHEAGEIQKITFTGDIGRYGDPILRDPEPFRTCDYLITESTYGDRKHPEAIDTEEKLWKIVHETCVNQRGKLIIPAFSVDRTQEIIYVLDQMSNDGRLPDIPVYVDSPLSVKATDIIRQHQECFRKEFIQYIRKDPDPFGFKNLHYITRVEDSKAINALHEPCIIISSSGMAEAGRVKHHIANAVENPKNTILFVGYCTPESLGGKLKSGEKKVRIFGEEFDVHCRIEIMDQYSAHADYTEMIRLFKSIQPEAVKQVFLVHGEAPTQQFFKGELLNIGFSQVEISGLRQTFILK